MHNRTILSARFTKIGLAVLLSILLVIIVVLLGKMGDSDLAIEGSNVVDSSYIAIKEDGLYFYNGVGFFKADFRADKITPLTTTPDTASITDVSWGKSGAVFKINGQSPRLSAVYKDLYTKKVGVVKYSTILKKEGLSNSDSNRALWYIDFKTGVVSFIKTQGDPGWGAVGYIESTDQFILSSTKLPSKGPLLVYSANTGEIKTLSITDKESIISDVFECRDQSSICIVLRSIEGPVRLFTYPNSINDKSLGNDLTMIHKTTSTQHIVLERTTYESKPTSEKIEPGYDDHSDDPDAEKNYVLYDLTTNISYPFNAPEVIDMNNRVAIQNNELVILGKRDKSSEVFYISKIGKRMKLKRNSLDFKDSSIVTLVSSYKDTVLGSTSSGLLAQVGVKSNNELSNYLSTIKSPGEIDSCTPSWAAGYVEGSTLNISMNDIDEYRLGDIRTCLSKLGSNPLSYSVKFEVISTQRPVID